MSLIVMCKMFNLVFQAISKIWVFAFFPQNFDYFIFLFKWKKKMYQFLIINYSYFAYLSEIR